MALLRPMVVVAALFSAVSLMGCGDSSTPETSATSAPPAPTIAAPTPASESVAWAQGVCTASTGLGTSVRDLTAAVPTDPSSSATTVDQVRAEVSTRVGAVKQSATSLQSALTALPAGADPELVAVQQELQTSAQRAQQAVDQLGQAAGKVADATTAAETAAALVPLKATLTGAAADVGAFLDAVHSSAGSRKQAVQSAFGAAPACAAVSPTSSS